ncbi:break repair meiotic recombinase recruitment factor 1 [Dromaius novaehollandiae]|uniref:break repair meiotic recombinase recruitment factor 1 n=1 Tax=Dromaius novaehollandiae TaxID=8790 RepID=UPI0031203CEB
MEGAEEREEKDQGSREANPQGSSNGEGKESAPEQSQAKQLPSAPSPQEAADCNPPNSGIGPGWKPPEATTREARSQAEASERASSTAADTDAGGSAAAPGSVREEPDEPPTCRRMETISNGPEENVGLAEQGEGAASPPQDEPREEAPAIEAASVFPGTSDKSSRQDGSLPPELAERHRDEERNANDRAEERGEAGRDTGPLRAAGASAEQSKPDRAPDGWVEEAAGSKEGSGEQQSAETEGEKETRDDVTASALGNAAAAEEAGAPEAAGERSGGAGAARQRSPRAEGSAARPAGLPPAAEPRTAADLSEPAHVRTPTAVGPGAEGRSHPQSRETSLRPTSYEGEAERGGGEAEREGIPSPGTSSASEPDSAVPIHADSIRKEKQDLPEERKENGSERAHAGLSAGEPRLDGLGEKLPDAELPRGKIQIPEAEEQPAPCSRDPLGTENATEAALAGKTPEPVPAEHVLTQLETEAATAGRAEEADAPSDDGKLLSAADAGLPGGVPADTAPEDEPRSAGGDELPPELEPLSDGDSQAALKDGSPELPPQQPFSGDNQRGSPAPASEPRAGGGRGGLEHAAPVVSASGPDEPQPSSAEAPEGLHAPAQEEDATDVVCGLIAELSSLNRLIMSAHRDLESWRRLKYRKSRRLGKFPPPPRGAATASSAAKKWKEM